MLTRKTDSSIGSASSLALLVLTVLFAAVSCGLPLSHQLCHEGHVEPENCPACLLQSSLSLLFGGLVLALVALNASEPNPSALCVAPLPLFTPRFTHLNRGPPRC